MYVTLSVLTILVILYLLSIWIIRSLKLNKKNSDLYVIVTGCDSGFGQELAYKLDKIGFNVYAACLTERAVKELDLTTSERLRTAKVDVTKSEDIAEFYEFVKSTIPNDKGKDFNCVSLPVISKTNLAFKLRENSPQPYRVINVQE